MSHFGRSGPPDIRDTYSLLVLNISFRTTADDLYPLFDRYGKVVDVFIPRDRRSGDSRGFAFVRYKYADEAQKAVERLDGRNVDGRNIMVQFAKYGPNAEPIRKGRIVEVLPKTSGRSRSRSPRPRYRDDYRDRDYRRRSRSRSKGRYDRNRYRERDYRHRSRSRSQSPDYYRGRGRRSDDYRRRSRSLSYDSASPDRRSYSPRRSPMPRRTPPSCDESPDKGSHGKRSPPSRSVSPRGRLADSRSPSPRSSDQD
ncbi:serine/arginine-rich splicing factor SC35 [Phoenix dactylifera]|uniref:Serine/arginine-rich splicing factor SC35 n=1 Tax=Phoenix dactylifera TaxID=42345 RepID=A0A8B8J9T7_PHODC|nr:serine/arginine-rich splicing factor SC35 [Phoenix dactylifera]